MKNGYTKRNLIAVLLVLWSCQITPAVGPCFQDVDRPVRTQTCFSSPAGNCLIILDWAPGGCPHTGDSLLTQCVPAVNMLPVTKRIYANSTCNLQFTRCVGGTR